jgi:O-antigen/teichoic acid export membrane protein
MNAPDGSRVETRKLDHALVGGFAWTAGAKWLSQLVAWPAVLITAKLLSPGDYGLTEMAGFYFVVTNVMAEFGIGMAVLQMRELDMGVTAQLNTIAAMSGMVAFLASIAAAPLIAAFFHAPELRFLVIVASFSFILTSLEAIPLGLLQRDMNYRCLSFAESIQAVVTSCISVGCAYGGLGYWSLVFGNMFGRAANIAFVVYNRPVRFAWPHLSQVLAPLRFGMEIAVQRVVSSVNGLSDSMVIGRTLGKDPVGAYRLAANLASTPSEKIGGLVMRVTGPLFSRVQGDRELMVRYFLIFTESLAMTTFPLLFGLAIVAPETVTLLLDEKWAVAAAPLRWLAIFMAVRTMLTLMNQLLSTLRFTRFGMWMSLLTFVLMPAAFYFASPRGVGAVALAWLLMSPITVVPIAWKVFRAIGCGVGSYLNALLPALVGCGAMLGTVVALRAQWHLHGWAGLGAEVAAGGLAYCTCLWVFYRSRVMRFVRFFADLRKSRNMAASVLAPKSVE